MRKEERHQIKRDDLASLFERGAVYVEGNVRAVSLAAAALAVLFLGGLGLRAWLTSRAQGAALLVGEMIETFRAPVGQPAADAQPAPAGPASFTTLEERDRRVLDLADRILGGHAPSGAASKAMYYRGLALANLKRYDEAAQAMDLFLKRYPRDFLAPMVRFELARVREAQGKPAEALVQFQTLARGEAGLFPREEGLFGMARCQEALGQKGEALETYKKILSDFPESEYAGEAKSKVAELS